MSVWRLAGCVGLNVPKIHERGQITEFCRAVPYIRQRGNNYWKIFGCRVLFMAAVIKIDDTQFWTCNIRTGGVSLGKVRLIMNSLRKEESEKPGGDIRLESHKHSSEKGRE